MGLLDLQGLQSSLFFESPEEICARVFRELKPRTAEPEMRVEFCSFANADSFIRLKDGRMFYAGRDIVNGKANTTVGYLSPTGQAMPLVVLPSGGDCSYPGLAEGPDGTLLVSYYSSHEGKTSIYFSRLKRAN